MPPRLVAADARERYFAVRARRCGCWSGPATGTRQSRDQQHRPLLAATLDAVFHINAACQFPDYGPEGRDHRTQSAKICCPHVDKFLYRQHRVHGPSHRPESAGRPMHRVALTAEAGRAGVSWRTPDLGVPRRRDRVCGVGAHCGARPRPLTVGGVWNHVGTGPWQYASI